MSESSVIQRVTAMVAPLIASMHLDLYDIEFRGGTLRITVDTPPGSEGGANIDTISLLTRMIGRDFDHDDPMPGHYTLEVTSPGLERTLRTPQHFHREIGKEVALRLRDTAGDERRLQGVLSAAGDSEATIVLDDGTERKVAYAQIDRARTVFVWGPTPKPGKQPSGAKKSPQTKPRAAKPAAKAAPRPSKKFPNAAAVDFAVPCSVHPSADSSAATPTQEAS